jgi:hypothetical protein
MKSVNKDRIGKHVTVHEVMTVLHSVLLSGAPLETSMKIEYLKGNGPDIFVQTTVQDQEPLTWDYNAISSGDFQSGKLDKDKIKAFAEDIISANEPVIALRKIILEHAGPLMQPERRKPVQEGVVHSHVRSLGS